jgi:acetylornithine deacetylase/succinyl-diaminopimelate desuccinylase-like protein
MAMDDKATRRFVNEIWDDSIVPTLAEYIRIPNKSPSFDPDWQTHGYMLEAVELLDRWCEVPPLQELRTEIITLPDRTPLLFAEVAGTAPDVPTVLLYGHYDKQPEFTGWADGLSPWEPVIRDGRLYGRGGADDGYALFGSLTAIAALQEQSIPHARCVLLIEGCEESGSYDLPYYMDALADRIGEPDLVVCLDAECGNYDQLWLTTSLRGMLLGTLNVDVLTEGVHSGAASGIVPSSFRVLRQLLDRIEDPRTGQLSDDLSVAIPDRIVTQAKQVAATLGEVVTSRYPWAGATGPIGNDPTELVLNNTWRPTLSVTGLSGAPEVSNAGNTLRPGTAAKLSFRLPPTFDAQIAERLVTERLQADPPYGATVRFVSDGAQDGWAAPALDDWLAHSLDTASKQFFGPGVRHMGTGGTIPFMQMLGERFPNVQFMVTGVLGPHSNAHGPNEFLDIETGKRVTCAVARVLHDHAQRK